ncbi:anti-sigma factor [Planctomicrobium piriforme]|uniref:Uncharacterized protein n=1 Tax=Planctomicrobium piriforme TaxID=1576369 RepID=A0A1I3SVT7_9PLAN|nr:hypothetical protein [Planctomicrobium piriforme]SFJ62948.1 hypothetical protein SAMN05421753_12610 [Planctomicrobium piriforme]
MKTSLNELLLQKCVDGELTEAERTALLKELHSSGSLDRWRTLALSFVENQVLAKAFEPAPQEIALPTPARAQPLPMWRRQIRPWVSVAASLMVGTMMGIGAHFVLKTDSNPNAPGGLAATSSPTSSPIPRPNNEPIRSNLVRNSNAPSASLVNPRVGSGGSSVTPVMNVNLGGSAGSGNQPMSVPVYSPEQWQSIPQSGTLTAIPEDVQRMLEAEGYTLDRERQWYRAPLEDGREILVPAETVRVRRTVQ